MTIESGKPMISEPFPSDSANSHPTILFTAPVLDGTGKVRAVLAGSFNLMKDNFLGKLASTKVGKGGYLYLFDNARTLIVHHDRSRILKRDVPVGANVMFDRAMGGFEGTGETVTSRGLPVLASFRRLATTQWIMASNIPLSEAYGPIDRARRYAAFILPVAVALGVATVWFFMGYLTAPLLLFAGHVKKLTADPETADRLGIRTSDEIGILADAFNLMQDKVKEQKLLSLGLLRDLAVPCFVLAPDHTVLVWNRACEELTGLKASEVIGTSDQWKAFYDHRRPTLADLVLDGNLEAVGKLYSKYGKSQFAPDGLECEGWYANVGGGERYIFFDAVPVRNARGETVAVVETLEDITERKRAEEAIRLSEEKFSKAFLVSPDRIVISRLEDGRLLEVNDSFTTLTGYRREEALGRTSLELGLWADPAERDEVVRMIRRDGRVRNREIRYRIRNGQIRILLWSGEVLALEGEECVLSIARDITEQKENERALLKNRAELTVKHEELSALFLQVETVKKEWELTMDCIGDMVMLVDSEGRVKRCNRALMEFVGKPFDKIIGAQWQYLVRGAEASAIGFTDGGGELFHESTGRWFLLTCYPFREMARPGIMEGVITVHETTAAKRASMELERAYGELKSTQSQMLQQEKMASIGQLAAGVAHEINNPTGFIMSNLGTLRKYTERLIGFIGSQAEAVGAGGGSAEIERLEAVRRRLKIDHVIDDVESLIAESLEGAERVKKIVQDLKSFSRVDEAEYKITDIHDCLESTINIVWNEVKYKADIHKEYGDIPPFKCFPQQLNQVFMNLVVNAAHAIERHGDITVRTWRDGESAFVAVSDTGCGIPEEIRNRIFEPFFTTKEVGSGTGLGLSISYDIVKKHGGEIVVESEVGQGTTFTVRLPLAGKG